MFPQYKLQSYRQRKHYRFERILNKTLPFHINPANKNASAVNQWVTPTEDSNSTTSKSYLIHLHGIKTACVSF